jgi:hypothetical protein
MCRS